MQDPSVDYLCGSCGKTVSLVVVSGKSIGQGQEGDTGIGCSYCGGKVLYKVRAKDGLQIEAR